MPADTELEELRSANNALEKLLDKTKKELERYKNEASKLSLKYSALSNNFNEISHKFSASQRLRLTAENEVSGLRKEIEDLSSALFSEANDMVSTARRSENDYKQKNRQLQNEIEEKDLMITTYQQQLEQLKDILDGLESQRSASKHESRHRPQNGTAAQLAATEGEGSSNGETGSEDRDGGAEADDTSSQKRDRGSASGASLFLSNILFAPPIQALRYDLDLYDSFLSFAKGLHAQPSAGNEDSSSVNDYSDIKETKFYKRILHDDIQPTLRLDTAPGVSFLQKRSLMSAIVNGRVIIEPIASVNESFKRNSGIISASASQSKPIATPDPCSICGESRNDALEHARLYTLKIYSSKTQKNKNKSSTALNNYSSSTLNLNDSVSGSSASSTVSNTATEFTYTFPLCAYCVFRIRSTCELYAFLRSVKAGVWKFNNEINQKKSWIECTRIRLKMFWSRQGIWDSDPKILDNKIFSADQIIGDLFEKGNANGPNANTGFQFQEKKTVPENYRHSYAGTIGSYVEKFTSGNFSPIATPRRDSAVASPIIKQPSEVKLELPNEPLGKEKDSLETPKEVDDKEVEQMAKKLQEAELRN